MKFVQNVGTSREAPALRLQEPPCLPWACYWRLDDRM